MRAFLERIKLIFSRLSTAQTLRLGTLFLLLAALPMIVIFNTLQTHTTQQQASNRSASTGFFTIDRVINSSNTTNRNKDDRERIDRTISSVPIDISQIPLPGISRIPSTGGIGTQLSFTVFLGGIGSSGDNSNPHGGGNQNPLHPQRTLTVFIYDKNDQLVAQNTGTITYNASPSGNFTGTIPVSISQIGTYTVKVKTDEFLRKKIPGLLTFNGQQTVTMQPVTLVAGDINGDNKIDISDYNILTGCYSDTQPAQSCTSDQKTAADLDDDGKVDATDYNVFLRNLAEQNGD